MLIFQILGNADYVFTSIFTLEIILKVMQPEKCILSVSFSISALPACLFPLVSFTLKPEIRSISAPDIVLVLCSGSEARKNPPRLPQLPPLGLAFGCQCHLLGLSCHQVWPCARQQWPLTPAHAPHTICGQLMTDPAWTSSCPEEVPHKLQWWGKFRAMAGSLWLPSLMPIFNSSVRAADMWAQHKIWGQTPH